MDFKEKGIPLMVYFAKDNGNRTWHVLQGIIMAPRKEDHAILYYPQSTIKIEEAQTT